METVVAVLAIELIALAIWRIYTGRWTLDPPRRNGRN